MSAPPIRLVIADDHVLFRQGLRSMLLLQSGVEVVAEVDQVSELADVLSRTPCDILLLDLQMERSSLVDIETLAPGIRIIVVTASERSDDALAALRLGAQGIVLKRYAIENLMNAIHAVAEGNVWVPPALQAALAAQLREPAADRLTTREREVARCVALGMRNAEIAEHLCISEVTVKTHLNNAYQKLGVRDRVELTRYAIRIGLIGVHERTR